MKNQLTVDRRKVLGALGAMTLSPMGFAAEDPFPSRPIKYILPFSAGSTTDILSRLVAKNLSERLGQPVVVENKPGAGGAIGTQQIARANPDGYTIGLVSLATLAMLPATVKETPYDSVRDFAPLSAIVSSDLSLVVGPRMQAKTLPDFVTWAKAQKKSVFLGTLGAGTSGHLAAFMFSEAAKFKSEAVHFRTFSDLLPAMVSGDIDFAFIAPGQINNFLKEGTLRGLATNAPIRMSAYPDVATFQEAGYPGMSFSNWIGLVAPAKTPPEILDRLQNEIIKLTNSPAVLDKLNEWGLRVIASTREEFAAAIKKDVVVWKDMVKATGFTV